MVVRNDEKASFGFGCYRSGRELSTWADQRFSPTLLFSLLTQAGGQVVSNRRGLVFGAAIFLVGAVLMYPLAQAASANTVNRVTAFTASAIPDPASVPAANGFGPPVTVGGGVGGEFYDVSCSSSVDCTAVGIADSGSPLTDTETNGIWGPDQLLSYTSSNAYFTSVSCTDALDCTAVGEGDAVPIYANESDGTWGAVTDISDVSGYFNSVSCTGIGDCTAVGDGTTDNPISFALVDTETDGTWGTPTDLYSIWDDPSLVSVSCTGAGDCTAVGNNNPPVYATESDGVWGSAVEFPPSTWSAYSYPFAEGVSCTDANDCTAVGDAVVGDNSVGPFYVTETAGTWGQFTVIPGLGGGGQFRAVSCTDATDCTAVGGGGQFFATETDGTWGPLTGSGGDNTFEGVSCTDASHCTAVGGYNGGDSQFVASTLNPGGSITLSKTTQLIGNYPDIVSGTGWGANGGSSVTVFQCATDYYSYSSCDGPNSVIAAVVATGKKAGDFKNVTLDLTAGVIDSSGDTCGVAGSKACYVVAVGSSWQYATSSKLQFTKPSATLEKSTSVPAKYVDKVTAADFPIGDQVTAQECDSAVNPATNLSTNCDSATVITGTVASNGEVVFSPTGVSVKVGKKYVETGTGTVVKGGTADIVVTDTSNSAVFVVIPITVAS
jgi:hypothetical protein